jgi:hypothetical protein
MDIPGRFGTSAGNLDKVSGGGPEDALGQMTAAGVSGAEDEDERFVAHGIGVIRWNGGSAATGSGTARLVLLRSRQADFLGETVGVFGSQGKENPIIPNFGRENRELGEEAVLMLDLGLEIVLPEYGGGTIDDLGQLSRLKTVVDIVRYPRLEIEPGVFADGSATIEECFVDTTDLGDVGMRRDQASVGQ